MGDGSLTEAVSGLSLVSGDGTEPQPGSLLDIQNVGMIRGLCSQFVTTCGPSSPSAVTVPLFEDATIASLVAVGFVRSRRRP